MQLVLLPVPALPAVLQVELRAELPAGRPVVPQTIPTTKDVLLLPGTSRKSRLVKD